VLLTLPESREMMTTPVAVSSVLERRSAVALRLRRCTSLAGCSGESTIDLGHLAAALQAATTTSR